VDPVQPNFGIRIKKLRFDNDMSQQDLAELCELSVEQISNIERGKSWTGEVSLALLANALRVSLKTLLDYSENDAFIRAGGLKWRASRKKGLIVQGRKLRLAIPKKGIGGRTR
jgi:transcriptional regulator with XRE-family HTH domain